MHFRRPAVCPGPFLRCGRFGQGRYFIVFPQQLRRRLRRRPDRQPPARPDCARGFGFGRKRQSAAFGIGRRNHQRAGLRCGIGCFVILKQFVFFYKKRPSENVSDGLLIQSVNVSASPSILFHCLRTTSFSPFPSGCCG